MIRFEAPVTQRNTPVLIKKHSIGHLLPHSDLRLSADHTVRVDQKMKSSESLVGHHPDVEYLNWYNDKIVYYHLQVENEWNIFANGIEAASYRPFVNRRHRTHRQKK